MDLTTCIPGCHAVRTLCWYCGGQFVYLTTLSFLGNLWRWVYLHALPPTDVCTLLWQIVACLSCLDLHLFPPQSFPPVTQLGQLWQLFEPQPSALLCEPPHSEVPHLSEGWRFTGDPIRIEIVNAVPPHRLPEYMIRPPPYGNFSMQVFLWDASKFQVCCSQAREKNGRKLDAGTFSPIRGVIFDKGNIFTVHFSSVPMINSGDGGGMMVSQKRLSSWIELFLAPSDYWWESMCCCPNENKDWLSSSLVIFSDIEE